MDSNLEISLSIAKLQRAHIKRQEEWCPDQKPDLSFRGNELGGECGEALNVIKKLERERHGWMGSRDTVEHLAEELADVIHCTVLVAITAGINLQSAVIDKFNSTTLKNGLATLLACSSHQAVEPVAVPDETVFRAGMQEAYHIALEQAALMADLAIEGEPENAHKREAMEAALTRFAQKVKWALEAFATHPATHTDDKAVDRFAAAMKAKLAKKRAEGKSGWDDPEECSAIFLSTLLREHTEKGDPLDVGNFAMMLHQRNERIASLRDCLEGD